MTGDIAPKPTDPAEQSATASCCENPDATSSRPCKLCNKPTCKNCRRMVNGKRVCPACCEQVEAELKAEQASGANVPIALAAGLVAALISGSVWALIVVLTNMEVGYVAIGVGWLAGFAVVMGAGGKKAQVLQFVAVGCAILGLLLGKYFTMAHVFKSTMGTMVAEMEASGKLPEQLSAVTGAEAESMTPEQLDAVKSEFQRMSDLSYFSPELAGFTVEHLGDTFTFFDILWALLALGIAWKMPKPAEVNVR